MIELDAYGNVIDPCAPDELRCSTCSESATRISSVFHTEGIVYHHYRCSACRDAGRMDGGTLVTTEGERSHGVGPVFRPLLEGRDTRTAPASEQQSPSPTAPRIRE